LAVVAAVYALKRTSRSNV